MSDTPRTDADVCEVPLVEQLESVPVGAREWIEIDPIHHRNIPYGRLCHDAAARIRQLERELAVANARIRELTEWRVRECRGDDNDVPVGQERLKGAPKLTEKEIQAFLEEDPK